MSLAADRQVQSSAVSATLRHEQRRELTLRDPVRLHSSRTPRSHPERTIEDAQCNRDAAAQLATGAGYSNDLLVSAVNEMRLETEAGDDGRVAPRRSEWVETY